MATRKRQLEWGLSILLAVGAAAGWLYVAVNQRRQNDPTGIVKRHFFFYPEYSHGAWSESSCVGAGASGDTCRQVTYTLPVQGCGEVTFDWRVYPGDDADKSWSYLGTHPSLDESDYPLYAVESGDSHFIDSPALGKPLPQTCRLK